MQPFSDEVVINLREAIHQTLFAGRYLRQREIGEGGMGTVFQAVDQVTGRPVALKILHRTAGIDARRFREEARALAAVRHPAVVRYVDDGQTDTGLHYLVMEWLDGETLSNRLERGVLSIPETI